MFNLITIKQKGRNMNTLKKIAISILASVFVFANANAGEVSVSGTAKATYTIISVDGSPNDHDTGKGLGVDNVLAFKANGELDNGWTWAYNVENDGGALDDSSITMGLGGLGTVMINISDGGIQKNFGSVVSAYGAALDTGAGGGYVDSADTGGMHSLRYTTPSGLPMDAVVKIQYAPYTGTGDDNAPNSAGKADANGNEDAIAYSLDLTPIEGLSLGASYFNPDDSAVAQSEEGGAWFATYDIGSVSLGYGKSFYATSLDTGTADSVESYDNTMMSIAFNVNDDLSISYEDTNSTRGKKTTGDTDMDVTSIQASYTVAGMTLSLSNDEFENENYAVGDKMKETIFAMSIAF